MQLIDIDKGRYRNHLNKVIVLCILCLAIGSLSLSQLLIFLFPSPEGSHFHWNLLGVILSCIGIGLILNSIRHHPFMTEVVYVWQLKQGLNKIARKMPALQNAAKQGNIDAMIVLQYCYAGSRKLWQLDDNTLTMDELALQQAHLDSLASKFNLTLDADDYSEAMLEKF